MQSASRLVAADPVQDAESVNPMRLVATEMASLTRNIREQLGSAHPVLDRVAKYYISEGKHLRPLIVLLMARALGPSPRAPLDDTINEPLSPSAVLRDINPMALHGQSRQEESTILPSQRRLAEITEMIHAASLLHDDVIDNATTRRGRNSGNAEFGNKMTILAGDFLLGRASAALARLRDVRVVELLATVIANLVEGEFMQLHCEAESKNQKKIFDDYLNKTYLKTASLICKSCRAAALLGGASVPLTDAAYEYGRGLGLAFQLVDDMLDFTTTASTFGKPVGADLQLGLATAPVLFAWEAYGKPFNYADARFPQLGPLISRKFAQEGDVAMARELVDRSDGVKQTGALAERYAEAASSALARFPPTEAREALHSLTEQVCCISYVLI